MLMHIFMYNLPVIEMSTSWCGEGSWELNSLIEEFNARASTPYHKEEYKQINQCSHHDPSIQEGSFREDNTIIIS